MSEDAKRLERLREERSNLVIKATTMIDTAEAEQRDMTEEEATEYDATVADAEKKDAEIRRTETAEHLRPSLKQAEVATEEKPEARTAVAKGELKAEKTYRPDNIRETSYFRDILSARSGDYQARERLNASNVEAWVDLGYDKRDMSTTATAGGDFLPPLYLGELYVEPAQALRPFVDALPKYPLPPTGIAITIPQLASGVSVAGRSDNAAVSETDGVTAGITHDVNEYAGQVDIGRIDVMRSDPGIDTLILRTLVRRYSTKVDTDALSGSGTAPAHRGLDNVSGINTTTWTQATPTGAGFLGQVYSAIADISTNRIEHDPDLIILHGRRAAWAAGGSLGTQVSLIQQSTLFQALGTQDGGFTETIAGLRVIKDNNIAITAGAGTNQDKAYLVCSEDLLWAEGPLYTRVFEDVGSGTGTIRYQVFAHSAFLSKRYPKAISLITGTGMVAPTFGS